MWGAPFEIALLNLCQMIPASSVYYITREEAYERLKHVSGEDFGFDPLKWEAWGREHGQFLPGWQGLPINRIE
jgi:hypothetical protein